ncbi:retrovirus-related pol polyprotein from transposon TNT 1-94 [Tanacetum coccineum]
MHNNIMAAGSRDRPSMLATERYAQWRLRFLRYIDTRPNGDALRKCILEGPYTPSIVIIPVVPATENSPAVPKRTTIETILNMSPKNKAHFESEKEAIHLLLIGIGDEIYLTVDACKTTHEMWEAIERLQQEWSRIAKNANPLALVAAAQPHQDPYYQTSKSHKSYAPTSKASLPTRSHATIRHKGKEIAKPITPLSESASEEDSDPEQAQKDKEMQKNLALIAKYFKKIYKPTNNNLRTSSNTRNKNVDTTPRYKNDNQIVQFGNQRTMTVAGARETVGSQVVQQTGIQCFNCKEFGHFAKECRKPKRVKDSTYHKEKMLLCKQAEKGVPLQAEQSDWLADTDEEIDEQELEAHYSYMAKIQEVPTADSGTDSEPLEQVQYDAGYNVFANERQHSEQPESISNTCVVEKVDSNVIPDSPDMCDNDIQNDQNAVECDDERVALANLIANLKLDVDENKKIQKQLKKANTTLAHELTECKSILAETSRTLGESNSIRDSCLVALQNKQTEFERYKTLNDRTVDYEKIEHKLNETLGLLAQKDIDIKEGLKLKAYEISVVKEKHDELVKQILLTKSYYEGPVKEKTKNDSFTFVHELKQEMHADLKYVESLEKEIDELESDRENFSNMYDMLLQECVSNDVMCSYLHSLFDLDAHTELQCLYLHKVKECECLAQKLSKQTEFVSKEIYNELLRSFAKLEKHSISLEIALQRYQEQLKNDTNIAISELKKLIDKCKGKSVDTKFDKPSVVRQPNAQRIPKPSVLGKPAPFSDSLVRTNFAKKKSVSKTNVLEGLSKPVTPQNFPRIATQAVRNTNVIKPGMYRIKSSTTQTRAPQLTQTSRNTNPRVSTSTGIAHRTNVSRPQPRSNQMKDKIVQLILFIIDSGCTKHMTSDHNSSELGIHDHSNELSSSKMVPKVVPPAYKTATSRQELELLFHHHITMLRIKKKCMDIGSKESSPPHNLGRNWVNTYAVRITMLIADIEDDIMDPVIVLRIILVIVPEHPSDTYVLTMKMEILLEPASNKLLVGDSLNLPDHRIHKDGDGDALFQLKSFITHMTMLQIKDIL